MKKTQKNTARAILIRSIVIVPLVATKVIWIKPSSFRNNTISVSVIMFVVASAQNDLVVVDDILERTKISFQPFEKQRNKSISFLFKRI